MHSSATLTQMGFTDPAKKIVPLSYVYGSRGPQEGELLRRKYGLEYHEGYRWDKASQSFSRAYSAPKL